MKEDNITYEVCPHCGEEVELENELKVQVCPHCGKHIVTCSMCLACSDGVKGCCVGCPLNYLADKMNEEKQSFEVILHLDADIDEQVEASTARKALKMVLDKYRNMNDDELLKHIGYFRDVQNAVVYDDKDSSCIICNESYKL